MRINETALRIFSIILIFAGSHMAVLFIRRLGERFMTTKFGKSLSKAKSVVSLVTSSAAFVLYFGALGLLLKEFNVSLTA